MKFRILAAFACLRGRAVVCNTHTTGITFVDPPHVFGGNAVSHSRR